MVEPVVNLAGGGATSQFPGRYMARRLAASSFGIDASGMGWNLLCRI